MMMEEDKRREKCVEECLKSSVMVKVSIKDARQRVAGKSSFFLRNKGQTCRSASGVFVADNVVLSEASILSPFVVVPTTTSNFDDNANGQHQPSIRTDGGDCAPPPSSSSSSRCCSHPPLSLHEDVEVSVRTFDGLWWRCALLHVFPKKDPKTPSSPSSSSSSSSSSLRRHENRLLRILNRITVGRKRSAWETRLWPNNDSERKERSHKDINHHPGLFQFGDDVFGHFALLKIIVGDGHNPLQFGSPSSSCSSSSGRMYPTLPPKSSHHIRRGEEIRLISSPYGILSEQIFANTVSSGIVSNKLGDIRYDHPPPPPDRGYGGDSVKSNNDKDDSTAADLILIDTRVYPGCEGGAVCSLTGELIGIVIGSISHKNLVHNGTLALVATWDFIARSLQELPPPPQLKKAMINSISLPTITTTDDDSSSSSSSIPRAALSSKILNKSIYNKTISKSSMRHHHHHHHHHHHYHH